MPGPGRPPKIQMEEDQERFIEPDRKPGLDYKAPKKDRIRCKVFNLELPGHDIEGCINGQIFKVQHGEVVDLAPSQIHALQNAIIDTFEQVEIDGKDSYETRPVQIPRFMVQIMGVTNR